MGVGHINTDYGGSRVRRERRVTGWGRIAIRVGGAVIPCVVVDLAGAHSHRLFEVCKFSGVANVMEPWGAACALVAGIGVAVVGWGRRVVGTAGCGVRGSPAVGSKQAGQSHHASQRRQGAAHHWGAEGG